MKDKSFKLLLCEVDKEKKRSQLLAIAFIPLSDLVQKSDQSGQEPRRLSLDSSQLWMRHISIGSTNKLGIAHCGVFSKFVAANCLL